MQQQGPQTAHGAQHRPTRPVNARTGTRTTTRTVSIMQPEKRQAALDELTTLASTGADRAALKDKGLQLGVPHSEIAMLVEKAIRDGRPPSQQTGILPPPGEPAPAPGQPGSGMYPHTQQRAPIKVGSSSGSAYVAIGLGLLLFLGGGIATITSYDMSDDGGFTLWYGAILGGIVLLIGGIRSVFGRD